MFGKEDTRTEVLPVVGQRNVLITSALPYVNNVPHLGNIIGCVLSGDVFARFCRLRGHNTIYICGTDEYGTATETKAMEEKTTPQAVCDKYFVLHRDIYQWFDIEFDHFGRTSTAEQTQIAQDIFQKCDANGWVTNACVQQLWCCGCERFLADRFVEGTCPFCTFADARGDQCDKCGKLLESATTLVDPKCKTCGNTPQEKTSSHLFLDLQNLTPHLEEWVNTSSKKGEWSSNSLATTRAWLADGLKPRSITRDMKWGTPVPKEGFRDKVFYVWFDAPIGYLSITANYTKEWRQWWKNPDNVELYQFMGKDNVPFHCVVFPSTLLGANDGYTLLHHISTTEYLQYENGKFSKSRGVGVFGDNARDTGIPAAVWRYYLLINRPEQSDAPFDWTDFAAKNNAELNNNLGNLLLRSLAFVKSKFAGIIPEAGPLTAEESAFVAETDSKVKQYITALEHVKIKDGLKLVMLISSSGNEFMQRQKPWVLFDSAPARCRTVLNILCNLAYVLGTLLRPYMPSATDAICNQMNLPVPTHGSLKLEDGIGFAPNRLPFLHEIGDPRPIFRHISDDEVVQNRARFSGQQGAAPQGAAVTGPDWNMDTKVGEIVAVEPHTGPKSDYVLSVDVGRARPLSVCAALAAAYPDESELRGKLVCVVCNVKASTVRGKRNEALILTALKDGVVSALTVDAPKGTIIVPESCRSVPDKTFDTHRRLSKLKLHTAERSVACMISDKGESLRFVAGGAEVVADKRFGSGAQVGAF